MKKNKKFLFTGFLVMLMIVFLSGPAISADSATILGIVNNKYQIVTDNNQIYHIAEGEKGDEVTELVGKKLKVAGLVEEVDEGKLITVTSYEVIEE